MKHSTRFTAAALCCFSLIGAGGVVRAQVVSDLTTTPNQWLNGGTAAGQFHLNSELVVTSAAMVVEDPLGISSFSRLSASLTSDSAGAPGTVLGTSNGATGTLSATDHLITFTFAGQDLAAGDYWLKLSGTDAGNIQWRESNNGITNTGTGGHVNSLVWDNYDGTLSLGALMSIDGHAPTGGPASTPEPGSIALLIGMGISGAGFAARRRHKA